MGARAPPGVGVLQLTQVEEVLKVSQDVVLLPRGGGGFTHALVVAAYVQDVCLIVGYIYPMRLDHPPRRLARPLGVGAKHHSKGYVLGAGEERDGDCDALRLLTRIHADILQNLYVHSHP